MDEGRITASLERKYAELVCVLNSFTLKDGNYFPSGHRKILQRIECVSCKDSDKYFYLIIVAIVTFQGIKINTQWFFKF